MTTKFTETKDYVALEDFLMIVMNTINCDTDYLFHKLVDAHSCHQYKMFDILDYMEEQEHVPSKELLCKISSILRDSELEIPNKIMNNNLDIN